MSAVFRARITKFIFFSHAFLFQNAYAQIVRLSQGFDNYTGTLATVPAGWYISWNSTAPASYNTVIANCGASVPSYNFGINQAAVITPHFQSGDVLSFWCRGLGTAFSVQNKLTIFSSADSITWNIFHDIDSLPAGGVTMAFNLTCSIHYLKFIYTKVNVNLAFDDVKVTMTDYFPSASFTATQDSLCQGDTLCFTNSSTLAGCESIATYVWDFGDGSPFDTSPNPCHVFLQPGNDTVWLRITATNGNADSTFLPVIIYPLPAAQFSSINVTGTIVDFTDLSSIISGSIISRQWDFGDTSFSSLQNPTHLYTSIGTYYACLTAFSNNGCSETFCDSVYVIGAGIEDYNSSSGISFGPNPAKEKLYVTSYKLYDIGAVEIFDILSQCVLRYQLSANSQQQIIDISRLNRGIYFLKVNTESKQLTFKFIIDK